MLLTARSHLKTPTNGAPHPHGRKVQRVIIAAMATALTFSSAGAWAGDSSRNETTGASTKTWSNQVRDYAIESLNDEQALSLAAIPMNGPGIEQYINADALMSPGSIMKLVTTYAALEILGPTYHWDTSFYTDGELVGDTLNGNLYVDMGGDPKLTIERLWSTLTELRGMGISAINGNLVLDGDVFRLANGQPAFDDNGDNPHRPFLVQPSPYLSNLNLVHFQVRADERGTQAWSAPSLNDVVIDNRVTATAEAPCPARSHFTWEPFFHEDHRVTVRVSGELPRGCRTTAYLSLLPHEQYTASLIRSLLSDMGIKINGKSLLAKTPVNARLLLRTTSPDLVTMVRDINKWSSNVMARQLLLTIGAEHRLEDEEDDRLTGIRVIREWLQNKGVNTAGMMLENGAGLTREARITARQGAQILQHAWNSPFSSDLMASMPLIAMDGTMARRLKNSGLDGKGRIKTGYLENVRSIAGFTRDDTNTTWAIVGMINNDPAWNGQAVLDRIIYSLHYRPPTGTTLSRAQSNGAEIR